MSSNSETIVHDVRKEFELMLQRVQENRLEPTCFVLPYLAFIAARSACRAAMPRAGALRVAVDVRQLVVFFSTQT